MKILAVIFLINAFASINITCKVVNRSNSTNEPYIPEWNTIQKVDINTKYLPANVDLDGNSFNERTLYYEENQEEVRSRSKNYVTVKKVEGYWRGKWDYSISITNDWDTFEMDLDLKATRDGKYLGYMSIYWDNVHQLQLECQDV